MQNYNVTKPPNRTSDNIIYTQLNVDHIVNMDHKLKLSEVRGFIAHRWMDRNLTWNPVEWGGIDMI